MLKEFKINQYITLKLENRRTIIFINGNRFKQCKYLFLQVMKNDNNLNNSITSIDDAVLKLHQYEEIEISPEEEFWGHCSNLHAWVEHGYDSRLLHSSLAFPLLKQLSLANDPKANAIFKEEIAKRFINGTSSVKGYLSEEGYLEYIDREAFWNLFDPLEVEFMIELENQIKNNTGLQFILSTSSSGFLINDNTNITEINASNCKLKKIPNNIENLKFLERLYLNDNIIEELPSTIGNLKSLQFLNLENNKISQLPVSIQKIKTLKKINIRSNNIQSPPKFDHIEMIV
ncbi:MAG: leucine-rich repeat domain-containing protein [Candidatus Thorarchaeota archaeon]